MFACCARSQSTLEVLQGEHDEIVDAHKALIEFTQLETDFRNASLAGDSVSHTAICMDNLGVNKKNIRCQILYHNKNKNKFKDLKRQIMTLLYLFNK